MFRLDDKIAIITGGTRGIGFAIMKVLLQQGARVVVVGRNEEHVDYIKKEYAHYDNKILAVCADVSQEKMCDEIVNQTIEKYGAIDILINCAGILTGTKIENITEQEWDDVININLKGAFFMIQKVIPHMKESGKGRIINISSNAGRMGGYENSQAYTASKGGMIAITMGIARQLAEKNITVNVVCPGTTETDMGQQFDDEKRKRLIGRIPMGRFGRPEDTAYAVCFLASDEASYITGAILDVNGGMYMG